jgi:ribosomal subunit interface protein
MSRSRKDCGLAASCEDYAWSMERSPRITFRGMSSSPAVEAEVHARIEDLTQFFDRVIGIDVVIDQPARHSRQGNLFEVHVEISVPGAPPIVVSHPHHDRPEHADVYVAIRDAFNAARRQLQDRAHKLRGD